MPLPPVPAELQALHPANLKGLGRSLQLQEEVDVELLPITPAVAAGFDRSFCQTARASQAACGSSLLDLLVSSALEEVPSLQAAGLPLPPPLPARVTSPPPVIRQRNLPPAPEVPTHILAVLRPVGGPTVHNAAASSPASGSSSNSLSVEDTAASGATLQLALQQATAWLGNAA